MQTSFGKNRMCFSLKALYVSEHVAAVSLERPCSEALNYILNAVGIPFLWSHFLSLSGSLSVMSLSLLCLYLCVCTDKGFSGFVSVIGASCPVTVNGQSVCVCHTYREPSLHWLWLFLSAEPTWTKILHLEVLSLNLKIINCINCNTIRNKNIFFI